MAPNDDRHEEHVAGVVVHAFPEAVPQVAKSISRMDGARVHAISADGKIVVTLEAHCGEAIADVISHIQSLEGVLAAGLVYQHCESAASMSSEVICEDHAQGFH